METFPLYTEVFNLHEKISFSDIDINSSKKSIQAIVNIPTSLENAIELSKINNTNIINIDHNITAEKRKKIISL